MKVLVVLSLCGLASVASAAEQEFDCMIEPAQVVEVRSPVVGIVQEVYVHRGQRIRKGDLLVTIESSVERGAVETARFRAEAQGATLLAGNKVNAAREKVRRMDELLRESFVSTQARDDASTELRLAESELKSAQESSELARLEHRQSLDQLNRRALRSPFDGVVMDRYLHPGAMVDGGEGKRPIMKIAQTQPLLAQAILPFRYLPQVRAGDMSLVLPEKPFAREIAARIKAVDLVVDSAAGTFGVVAEINNSKQDLPGGIRCKLRLNQLRDR